MELEKECIVCGKEFTAKREDAKYCSGSCKVKAHKQRKAEPKEQTTEQERGLSIQDAIDQTTDNRSRIKDVEQELHKFKTEIGKAFFDISGRMVYKSENKIIIDGLKESIVKVLKSAGTEENENEGLKKTVNNLKRSNESLVREVSFLKEELAREVRFLKEDFQQLKKQGNNTTNTVALAGIAEKVLTNDAVLNKLIG